MALTPFFVSFMKKEIDFLPEFDVHFVVMGPILTFDRSMVSYANIREFLVPRVDRGVAQINLNLFVCKNFNVIIIFTYLVLFDNYKFNLIRDSLNTLSIKTNMNFHFPLYFCFN